jgi:hypothetical protein
MQPRVKLKFPNFENMRILNELKGETLTYHLKDEDCYAWYDRFVELIERSMAEKSFLPIYRMGDGEYEFLLKCKKAYETEHSEGIFASLLRTFLRIFAKNHASGSKEDGQEEYKYAELPVLYQRYISDLKLISSKGIITLALDDGRLFKKYVDKVLAVFEECNIDINLHNYFNGYFVYALFCSKLGYKFFTNRRILVISSFGKEDCTLIESFLLVKGAIDVDFKDIPKHGSMYADVKAMDDEFDLILIAAGIGSSRIISQLQHLSCPCIDVGTVLNCYANPDRFFERPYMAEDYIHDIEKMVFISEELKNKYLEYVKSDKLNSSI